jgi:hypothetical protein
MQEMAGGDNNRTPVVFQDLDNCRIVGYINPRFVFNRSSEQYKLLRSVIDTFGTSLLLNLQPLIATGLCMAQNELSAKRIRLKARVLFRRLL